MVHNQGSDIHTIAADQVKQQLAKRLPKTGKSNLLLKKHLESVTKPKKAVSIQKPFIVQSNVKIVSYISPLKPKKTPIQTSLQNQPILD